LKLQQRFCVTHAHTLSFTHHEGIVEGSKDVGDGKVLIAIGDLVLEGGDLLDGLLFLSGSLSLASINKHTFISKTQLKMNLTLPDRENYAKNSPLLKINAKNIKG
jgi:hypothetical protein